MEIDVMDVQVGMNIRVITDEPIEDQIYGLVTETEVQTPYGDNQPVMFMRFLTDGDRLTDSYKELMRDFDRPENEVYLDFRPGQKLAVL